MATISDLNIRLGLLSRDFERDLRRFERSMQASAARIGRMGESLSIAFTVPLLGIGAAAIKTAGDMEALSLAMTTTFSAVGRSAVSAENELRALREVAKAPGLEFEQAVKGSIRLQGVGLSAEKARVIIAELGNQIATSGGSADQLDAVTKQFTQIIGKGRILQEDLTIILENMPSLAAVLREEFGTTSAEALRSLGVGAEDFIDRITSRMQTLPRAVGGISNSLVNTWSAIRQSANTVGDALNKAFNVSGNLDAFAIWVTSLADRFAKMDAGTQKSVVGIGVFVAALGPALSLMSVITSKTVSMVTTFEKISESFRLSAAAGTGTIGMFSRLSTAMKLSIFVGASAVVLALAAAFSALSLAGGEASEEQRVFVEAQRKVTEETGRETAILNKNFEVLKNSASSTQDRTAAIRELQVTYPDYLRNVDLEKSSLVELTEIQGDLNEQILRSVAERQKAIAVEEQYNKAAQAQLRITQLRKGGFESLSGEEVKRAGRSLFGTEFEKGFVLPSARANVLDDVIKALEGDVKQATGAAKDLASQFDETFQIGTKAANRQYDALTQQRQAVQDAEDALENITPAQRNALQFAEDWDRRMEQSARRSEDSASAAKQQAQAYRQALASIAAVTQKEDLLGAGVLGEQAREIETQIERLLEAGFKPYSREILHLRDMLKSLFTGVDMRGQVERIQKEIEGKLLADPTLDLTIRAKIEAEGVKFDLPRIAALEIPQTVVSIETSAALEALNSLSETALRGIEAASGFKSTWEQIAEIVNMAGTSIGSASQAMGEAINLLVERGSVINAVFVAMGQGFMDTAAEGVSSFGQLATAAIASGLKIARAAAIEGIFSAVKGALKLPFPINLAAAALAAGAAAALFNGLSNKIAPPRLAEGGVIKKPMLVTVGEYPGANTNPEIVTPEKKMRTVFESVLRTVSFEAPQIQVVAPQVQPMLAADFTAPKTDMGSLFRRGADAGFILSTNISGSDLQLVLERAGNKNKRTRGY